MTFCQWNDGVVVVGPTARSAVTGDGRRHGGFLLLVCVAMLASRTIFIAHSKKLTLPNPPTVVMVDNKSAVQMSLNGKLTKHTRHISRRYHYVKEGAKLKLHAITWCPGEDMVADIMTKSTDPGKTKPQRDRAYYRLPKFLWN